jgi:hypothetical protein
MRTWMSAILAVTIAGVVGCGDDMQPTRPRDLGIDEAAMACVEPLADFCARGDGGACPSYDAAVAALRARATVRPCYLIRLGSCGAFRFTEESLGGLGLDRRYYGADGSLVAVELESDATTFCGGSSFSITAGSVPTCSRVETELLCLCQPGSPRDGSTC